MMRPAMCGLFGLLIVSPVLAQDAPPAQLQTRTLIVEREVNAPVEEVWDAFTDAKVMQAWIAPHVSVDLCLGGKILSNYDPNGSLGDANTIESKVLSFEPLRMLSTQNIKAPADFPFAEGTRGTWSVSYFTPLPNGRTRVRLVGMGWPKGEAGDKAYAFFERANAYSLDLLEKHLAGQRVATPRSDGADVPVQK